MKKIATKGNSNASRLNTAFTKMANAMEIQIVMTALMNKVVVGFYIEHYYFERCHFYIIAIILYDFTAQCFYLQSVLRMVIVRMRNPVVERERAKVVNYDLCHKYIKNKVYISTNY